MRDETSNSQPPAAGTGPSRRDFMYGTTAAAAGAVLLRRIPGPFSHPAGHAVTPAGHVVPLVGSSGSFTFVQAEAAVAGSGSLALSLTTKQKYSLLVATIMSEDGSPAGAFTTTTSGWHRASAVPGKNGSGRVEIWYRPGTPDTPGTGGSVGTFSVTFNTSAGTTCRGAMTEFGVPQNLPVPGMIAVLDAPGQGSGHNGGGGPTKLTMTPASGNVGGALGIVVAGDFFASKVSGSWTAPGTGWAPIRTLGGTVTAPWGSWYDLNLSAGVQPSQSTSPTFSLGGDTDWAVAFAAFRGVVFPGIYLDGAENTNIVALDPTGQELILGGDVEGMWRSADFGDHWQLSQDGIWGAAWRCTASVAWSQTVAAEVYACVGKKASANDGGFMVSTDGGVTWSMRAPATKYNFLNFQGNNASDVLPPGEGVDENRSVGHLIAQDPTPGNSFLYAATYNAGIARSHDDGTTWNLIGLKTPTGSSPLYFARALAIDPATPSTLYVGVWQNTVGTTTYGGLYASTNANAMTPTFSGVGTAPSGVPASSTVSGVKVLGGNVYVTYTDFGIFLYKSGTGTWFSLNSGLNGGATSKFYGLWTALDVYQSGSNHVVVAVCGSGTATQGAGFNFSNVVRITVNPATGAVVSTDDLTDQATINTGTVPPDNQTWWHGSGNFKNWLGANAFHNPHVLVNPQNTRQIFVTGASGHFRTDNAGASPTQITWDVAVNGAPAIACFDIAIDPNSPDHFAVCGDDYAFIDVSGDNTGFGASTTVSDPNKAPDGSKLETHAASFDRRPSITVSGTTYHHVVYVAVHNKFGQVTENANGDAQWTSAEGGFHPTGLGAKLSGTTAGDLAVTGVYAGNPGAGPYVVAAAIGNGVWQSPVPSDPTQAANWNWAPATGAPTLGTANSRVQHTPIVPNVAGDTLYLFDRAAATLYRSKKNSGTSWQLIWTLTDTVDDERSGWLAVNPTVTTGDELWVATSQNIWKLPDASTGTVAGGGIKPAKWTIGGSTNFFPEGCGGLAFTTKSGTLYAVSLNGQTQPSAQLLSLVNGGLSSAWKPGDPGNSFGSYVSRPGPARMTTLGAGATSQTLLVGSNPNLGIYGTVNA